MKNIKPIIFISVLSLACVLFLTFAYQFSKPIIVENEKMDGIKNVLNSFDIPFASLKTTQEVKALFEKNVEEQVVGSLKYFTYGQGADKKYCFPVIAKGLWGMIFGFISLESDLKTVFRVAFHKHQETPGLGARIDEGEFRDQFKGLSLYDDTGKFGILSLRPGKEKFKNSVDSISGATLTSDAVVKGINESLDKYIKVINK